MSINFIVDSMGKLTGLTAVIQNLSKFPIQVSSLEINAASNWNIVPDASKATESNAIDFQIGPEGNMLDASSYLTKNWVSAPAKWNIAANEGPLVLKSAGDVNNVTSNIAVRTKVATMHWQQGRAACCSRSAAYASGMNAWGSFAVRPRGNSLSERIGVRHRLRHGQERFPLVRNALVDDRVKKLF